jgi:hypothetical protein
MFLVAAMKLKNKHGYVCLRSIYQCVSWSLF